MPTAFQPFLCDHNTKTTQIGAHVRLGCNGTTYDTLNSIRHYVQHNTYVPGLSKGSSLQPLIVTIETLKLINTTILRFC